MEVSICVSSRRPCGCGMGCASVGSAHTHMFAAAAAADAAAPLDDDDDDDDDDIVIMMMMLMLLLHQPRGFRGEQVLLQRWPQLQALFLLLLRRRTDGVGALPSRAGTLMLHRRSVAAGMHTGRPRAWRMRAIEQVKGET